MLLKILLKIVNLKFEIEEMNFPFECHYKLINCEIRPTLPKITSFSQVVCLQIQRNPCICCPTLRAENCFNCWTNLLSPSRRRPRHFGQVVLCILLQTLEKLLTGGECENVDYPPVTLWCTPGQIFRRGLGILGICFIRALQGSLRTALQSARPKGIS